MSFRVPPSDELFFRGRPNDPRLGELCRDSSTQSTKGREILYLWGCPDDTGVRKNRGRGGAKLGPDSIRKHFYRMSPPMDLPWDKYLLLEDKGNLIPADQLKETQSRCEEAVTALTESGATLLALGGGHDFASPNFLGFARGRARLRKKKEKLALINVDPHLDVRELEGGEPNSGTPFRQILESGELDPKRFVEFGARSNRNARSHFEYCRAKGVRLVTWEAISRSRQPVIAQFRAELRKLCQGVDTAAVTIDMDACAESEGTSAAPVIGFSARELCAIAEAAGSESRVRFFEIAEVAPALDTTERSSRIAAEMLFHFLRARADLLSRRKR